MSLDKKGDLKYSTLGKIILVLIIAVILIYATSLISSNSKRGADIAACKAWTVFQSAVKDPVIGRTWKEFQNPCITFKDAAEGNRIEVYKLLSDGMHDVWKMYGEGEIDFFTDRGLGETNCFIGDEITFDKDIGIDSIDMDGFEDYLAHQYPPNADYTYSEFFLRAEDAEIDFGYGNIEINPEDKVYIVFIVHKIKPETLEGNLNLLKKNALKSTGSILGLGLFPKKISGTVTTRLYAAPKGGMQVAQKVFFKGGQTFGNKYFVTTTTKISKLAKVGKGTLITGVVISAATLALQISDQSVMMPSIAIFKGDELTKEDCDHWHYNPRESVFKFSGGDTGGGGAGRGLEDE